MSVATRPNGWLTPQNFKRAWQVGEWLGNTYKEYNKPPRPKKKRRLTGSTGTGPHKAASGALTRHHDSRVEYRRRRKPRRQRKRWRSFKKRVRTIIEKQKPRSFVLRQLVMTPECPINSQAINSFGMYSVANTALAGWDDVLRLEEVANQSPYAGLPVTNFFHRYCNIEINMENRSSTKNIVVDVYFCYCNRDCRDIPDSLFQLGIQGVDPAYSVDADNAPSIVGGSLTSATVGVTPFQAPTFCRYLKIVRKQKYNLQPGGNVDFDWKTKPMKYWEGEGEELNRNSLSMKKGWTQVLLIISRAYPSLESGLPLPISDPIVAGDLALTALKRYDVHVVDAAAERFAVSI